MSLGARLLERANHVRHAMQVCAATRRDRILAFARARIPEVVPAPERLEDRLLLSSTVIDIPIDPIDHGFTVEDVGGTAETVQAVDAEDGPAAPIADNLAVAESGAATILDSGPASLLASDIGTEANGLEAVLDPDAVGWASVRNLTNGQFASDFATRKIDHFLIDIEVNEIDGQQFLSGVWQQNVDGRLWNAHHNLTNSQFSDQWTLYRDTGYRLIDQESYVLGSQRYYAGIWIENLEGYAWGSYRNVTSSEFSDLFEDYEDNHIPIDFDAYTYGGDSTRYAAAWVENNDALQWILRYDLTTTEFASEFSTNKDFYRVHDIESYQVGGQQRYAAIWIENSNGREWAEARDMNVQGYRNRWLRYRDMGFRLTDFEQYETGDGIRYAGVWRQNTDRPDWYLRSAIDAIADAHLEDHDIPGMSIAIVSQGQIKYMRGFGYQDVADDVWYSARTINRLASVSKAVAGVLLLKLADQDTIDPSASTSDYVAGLPDHHTHTLKQLSSNRAGIGHYLELGLGTKHTQYDTALEASALFWDKDLVSAPGTSVYYSTHGYTLLGAGIEGATGQAIDDVLDDELGSGLGLTTLKAEDRSVANEFRTTLYKTNNNKANADNISWKILGGGMEASAYDLARFSEMLMDGHILSSESLEQLWTVPLPKTTLYTGAASSYAMGWYVKNQQGHRSIEKGGAQRGANAYLQLFPELDLGIVVLINRDESEKVVLSEDIADAILTGTPSVGAYVELNPFGDATLANTLTNSADTDVFAFALDLNGNTQIDVDDYGGSLDPGLGLWDLEDDVIMAVDRDSIGDDPQIVEWLSSSSLYAAEVFSENSSGDFTLSIDGPTPFISTTSLDADGDATRTDTIGGSGNDTDYFRFVAPITSTGDLALTLTPDAGSGLNGVLTLYDSTGVQLLRTNGGGSEAAETINYSGAVAGETYYARAGAYNYGSAGGYTLDVDFLLPLPTTWAGSVEGFATMHRDGVSRDVLSRDANINFAGDIDSYYFGSDTAGTVTIDVDDFTNGVDPVVAVYNASTGALLGFNNDVGGIDLGFDSDNARVSVDISNNTRYIVAVADDNGTETGNLGITIDTPMNSSGSNIVIGIDGIGTSTTPGISPAADSDFLSFTTPSNTPGTGSVTVTPAATLDVEFVMFDAAGNELDRGNPSSTGNPSSFSYNGFAPNTEYYLTIHSDDYETTGDVTLVEVDLDLYGEIHGTKFYDRDQDGIWDRGEESLPGWTIYLDENDNGVPDPDEPMTVTDKNGEYAFTNLLEGTHLVREILKEGWTQTAPGPAATLLYNVDFDTPPHTVGAAPATGAGPATREKISSIQFGTPTVVAASGTLDQPLLFATSTAGYEQVHFDLDDFGQTFDHYAIQMDLFVQTLGGSRFAVLIDSPTVRKIDFLTDGTIQEYVPGSSATQIGNYVQGVPINLRIDLDFVAATWAISLDGTVVHGADFAETDVDTMRLNLAGPGTEVAVDNVIIRGSDFGFTDDGHTITLSGGEVVTADFGNISNDSTSPHVTEVLVRGSWTPGYFDELNNLGLGHGGYAIPVGSGEQLDPLPFAALDELVVRFNEPVNIGVGDVRLVGVLGPDGIDDAADNYNIVGVTTAIGVTGDFEAVIELDAPIATDKLLLTVFDATVDASFNHLDGEWTDGVSTYPSGNGDEGGDFSFRFNVLPGDLTQNETVEGGDLSMLLGSWLQSVPPVHPLTDITGNTLMDGGDLSVLLGNWLTGLPNGTPTNSANGGVTVAALLETSGVAGSLGRFGLGSVSQWRGDRGGPATLLQDDDDNVDLLSTMGGRTIMVDTARSLAI